MVVEPPLGAGRPIWVDDPAFDVARHVRLTALPGPGTRRQLVALAERLLAAVLDRGHPLWEMWFVEGLDGGKHVGLVHRSHHALTDGISGVDIATALLDLDPARRRRAAGAVDPGARPRAGRPPRRHGARERAAGSPGSQDAPVPRCRHRRPPLPAPSSSGGRSAPCIPGGFAPKLAHNSALAPGRRLETVAVPLAHVHEVRDALGCTVNDVVLAAVGTGFARVLDDQGDLTDDLVIKMVCPVSLRVDAERAQLGNRISTMIVPVAGRRPRSAGPTRRGARDHDRPQGARAGRGHRGAVRSRRVRAAGGARRGRARALHAQPFGNVVTTNIPGPDVPLYLLGAQMLEVYPVVPLSRNLTLNVAVLSYCGQLHFGLLGDGASGRDLELLAGGIEDAFDELSRGSRSPALG